MSGNILKVQVDIRITKMADRGKTHMTRTETAERIVRETLVFVRKARREGCSNMVTDLAFQETAEKLRAQGTSYSMRTVRSIARREMALMGETHLIGFERSTRHRATRKELS